jgi:hypothetical protein
MMLSRMVIVVAEGDSDEAIPHPFSRPQAGEEMEGVWIASPSPAVTRIGNATADPAA